MANRNWTATFGATLALALGTLAIQAGAVPLAPGAAVATPGTTAAARPELAGVVVADVIRPIGIAVGNTVVRGWMQDRVVRSNATGTLDFYYRIYVHPGSSGSILQVRRSSFAPAAAPTDVDWRIDGLGLKNPTSASRTITGVTVAFNHLGANAIMPGQQSRFTFVKTRAKKFNLGTTQLRFTGPGGPGVYSLPTFQPVY